MLFYLFFKLEDKEVINPHLRKVLSVTVIHVIQWTVCRNKTMRQSQPPEVGFKRKKRKV